MGMDWLLRNRIQIYCAERELILSSGEVFPLNTSTVCIPEVCCLEFQILDELTVIIEDEYCNLNPTDVRDEQDHISVVREFPQIFPEDLVGLTSEHEIVFEILLKPSSAPISVPPYRIAIVEMIELEKKIGRITGKGIYIAEYVFGGVPVLFVKKKDRTL